MALNGKKNTSKFDEKVYKKLWWKSDKVYILEVVVECPKSLKNLHNDLPFLPERMKMQQAYL